MFNVFNSFGIIDFICFGFVSFGFILDIYFSRKKLLLINLNVIFPEKIYCIFSYILLTSNKGKFQPQTKSFLGIANLFLLSLLLCGSRFLKKQKISFSGLRSPYNRLANTKKLILSLEKYFKLLKDTIIITESFTIFQSGQNNGVETWTFDAIQGHFQLKLHPILIA